MPVNYVYSPLSEAGRQIRLLTIRPGAWSDMIECSLHITNLDDRPHYEALSYVWGDANKKIPISLDNQTFEVTENLYYALRRLRSSSSPRTMWIDAICINQKDNDEKSIQVNMMGTIYSNCQKAVLWLGEDPEIIRSVTAPSSPPSSSVAKRAFQLCRILGQDRHLNELPCFSTTGDGHELIIHPYFQDHFESLKAITYVPWWTRIWILQEMALPGQIEFAFASETCPYAVMYNFLDRNVEHREVCCSEWWGSLDVEKEISIVVTDLSSILYPLLTVRHQLSRDIKLSLLDLREQFWSFEATDPRDFIYGLLGMVRDWGDAGPLIPDYNLPPSTVICEALFRCIRQSGNLNSLLGTRWLLDNMGLPSWVPDMKVSQVDRVTAMFYIDFKTVLRNRFGASKLPCSDVDLISSSVLRLQSLTVDTIKVVGDPMQWVGLSTRYSVIRQWMTMCGIRDWPADPPPETSIESQFWRAIINDCVPHVSTEVQLRRRTTQDDYHEMKAYVLAIYHGEAPVDLPYGIDHSIGLVGSVMFLTESGMVGIGPAKCQSGDEVHVFRGSKVPYILRPETPARLDGSRVRDGAEDRISVTTSRSSIPSYSVIGDGFLHGVMDGEAEQNNLEGFQTVDLV
ncbi:HET-domain-containing protein [Hypoxylon sp. NC0597]|nr:HET-domain-containing protein [Hypoxylon sp. NC0597]